ncbi:MAG: YggS family pyridoxal phosphate enzyme [Armatimonadetes bacterium 55-13]|nr:MAG: YggS family pyridoxal phosphate enzyme [Armatimonadetes bacterium 55-13]
MRAMSIAKNIALIQSQIDRAAETVQRDPNEITLIAVSKTFPIDAIREAYDAGHRHFGESRLQEAQPKIEALPGDIVWHFIGNLQSNKAKKVAQLFEVIHTLESESQLKEIAKAERQIDGFIEVNIAKETQKAGISTDEVDELIEVVLHYPQVRLCGLMTIGPVEEDPETSRKYFRVLKNLANEKDLKGLSMGMSQDFDVAIQEGATHIRVGSAIFGSRT